MIIADPDRGRWVVRNVDSVHVEYQDGLRQVVITDHNGQKWNFGSPSNHYSENMKVLRSLGIEASNLDIDQSTELNRKDS